MDLRFIVGASTLSHPALSSIADRRIDRAQKAELKAWDKAHRWHPNQLRHTRRPRSGRDTTRRRRSVLLGHCSRDMTQIYAERDLEKAQAVARKIG